MRWGEVKASLAAGTFRDETGLFGHWVESTSRLSADPHIDELLLFISNDNDSQLPEAALNNVRLLLS
jgi:hypothetical protein